MTSTGYVQTRRAAGSRGFTFVELMLSVGILAIVAVGTAAAMVQGPRLSRVAREEMMVRSAMRGMVAEISSAPYSEVAAAFAGEGFEVPGIAASSVDADKLPGVIRVDEMREGTARYFRVTLTVNWQGVEGTRSITSVHYVSNVRGDTASELPAGTPLEDVQTVSTDPNIAYYDDPALQAAAEGEPTLVDPVLEYIALNTDPELLAEATAETEPAVQPVVDPVETVATSVNGNGKGKANGKNK
jgi:prepilin-type N-terminal cleavage/methylation domain-containing protein